jgi:hypothetical protein
MVRRLRFSPAIAFLGLLTCIPAAQAAQPLTTGFSDPAFATPRGGQREARLRDAAGVGAQVVRLNVSWFSVAHQRPGGDPSDPANPGYTWDQADAAVRSAAGFKILMVFDEVPSWAEGPGRPAGGVVGAWRPDAAAFGAFAQAAARRYSGSYPDPLLPGRRLPRISLWEAWNEPNLASTLEPQWERVGGTWVPASPAIYRGLLNAFYAGVKSVSASNLVIGGSMSPFGDDPGGDRIRPALFARELFCLRPDLRPNGCSDPPHLDALNHHPYDSGGPARRALNADDISTPDMGKLARILRVAERNGLALPRHHKRLWVTELSWESNPPDPAGIPILQHARWLEYSFYVLWRAGVDTVLWYQVRDELPVPSYSNSFQSAPFFNDGTPKPAAQAFRFPFIFERINRKKIRVWGKTPDRGRVTVQRRAGSRWRTLATVRPGSNRVFYSVIKYAGRADLRAISRGGVASIDWPARVNLVST